MARTNVTLPFQTIQDRHYIITADDFDGHTITLQYMSDSGNWEDVLDDSDAPIVATSNLQGRFFAPTTKMRVEMTVAGSGPMSINIRPSKFGTA